MSGKAELLIKPVAQKPPMWTCIFINDDYTPMGFVMQILMSIFHRDEVTARQIFVAMRADGRASVGTYTHEIALMKAEQTIRLARQEGYPLIVIPTSIT